MDTFSTQEILEKVGLKSSETLRRWRSLGLIPAPDVVPHANGRGRIAQWPVSILTQCLAVRAKLQDGQSLDQIAASAGKRNNKHKFKDAMDRRETERNLALVSFRENVIKAIRRISRHWLAKLENEIVGLDHLNRTLEMDSEGHHATLVVTESGAEVVSADGISDWLSEHPRNEIMLLLPLNHHLPAV